MNLSALIRDASGDDSGGLTFTLSTGETVAGIVDAADADSSWLRVWPLDDDHVSSDVPEWIALAHIARVRRTGRTATPTHPQEAPAMTNPDTLLTDARRLAEWTTTSPSALDGDTAVAALADLARIVRMLDAHLTAGGTPPEAWREGPDAPELDDEPAVYAIRRVPGSDSWNVVDTRTGYVVSSGTESWARSWQR